MSVVSVGPFRVFDYLLVTKFFWGLMATSSAGLLNELELSLIFELILILKLIFKLIFKFILMFML